jgi:hypothetical protein
MMPPFFTLSGIKLYTPGFLIFKFFPMFRAMARLSSVVLFCLLLALAEGLEYLYENNLIPSKVLTGVFVLVFVVVMVETVVPIKLEKYAAPPSVYSYINEHTAQDALLAVYPYQATKDAFYWLDVHQRCLVNVRGLKLQDFAADSFTANIRTQEGRSDLVSLGVNYLVVMNYPESYTLVEDLKLDTRFALVTEVENSYLYKVR